MVNEIRGEREITLGSKSYVVALTFGAQAALEAAFGVDNFEAAFQKIGRTEPNADDPKKERFFVSSSAVLKLWATILKANGHDASALEREPGDPYAAATQAFDLLRAARETWFGADAKPSADAPLADAPAGGTG